MFYFIMCIIFPFSLTNFRHSLYIQSCNCSFSAFIFIHHGKNCHSVVNSCQSPDFTSCLIWHLVYSFQLCRNIHPPHCLYDSHSPFPRRLSLLPVLPPATTSRCRRPPTSSRPCRRPLSWSCRPPSRPPPPARRPPPPSRRRRPRRLPPAAAAPPSP